MDTNKNNISVLIIDDDPDDIIILSQALKKSKNLKYSISSSGSLHEGLEVVKKRKFDLVILDLNLPDSKGYDTFKTFNEKHFGIPVVVMTGLGDEATAVEAIRMGAQDYIVKGSYNSEQTAKALRFAIERHQIMSTYMGYSIKDELTGLYNRRGFMDYAEKQLNLACRDDKELILVYADLDNMKLVNDNYGHSMGDQLLKDVAEILPDVFRNSDVTARIGGDDFVVLAVGASPEYMGMIIARLLNRLKDFNSTGERPYEISLSVGVSSFNPKNPISLDELMHRADQAMYMDKKSHKSWLNDR